MDVWSHIYRLSSLFSYISSYTVPLFYMVSLISVIICYGNLSLVSTFSLYVSDLFYIFFVWKNQLYTKDASRIWKLVGSDGNQLTMKEPSANVVLLDHISTEKWQDVVDFDDHLDDISKWVQYNTTSVSSQKLISCLEVKTNADWKFDVTGIGWTQSSSSKLGINSFILRLRAR